MMDRTDEDIFLRGACSWQWKGRQTTQSIGFDIETYIKQRGPEFRKKASVVDVWNQLLPLELSENCRITDLVGGSLHVRVQPGPFMHELRTISTDLIEQLQRICGRAAIRRIVLRPTNEMNIQTEDRQ